jgi:exodeoxyribonuclease VIII
MRIPPDPITHRVLYDGIQALNYSGSKELLKSPAHYQAYLNQEREETKALRMGSLIHCAVLQPELLNEKFVTAPICDKRTKEGKAIFLEFESTLKPGMTVVSAEEFGECYIIASAAKHALERMGVEFEMTEFMFTTDHCGVQLKCAIDGVGTDGYLYDLKTTEDASPAGILKSIRAYRYNLQAYFYRLCFETAFERRLLGFRFLFVEKAPPYATAWVEIGPELMSYACSDFEKALQAYRECTTLGEWPAYGDEVQVIDIKPSASASNAITFA